VISSRSTSRQVPEALFGQQGLQAWGYRLGDYKGDYKGPWDAWSQEMQSYCEQDVEVTHKAVYNTYRPSAPGPVPRSLNTTLSGSAPRSSATASRSTWTARSSSTASWSRSARGWPLELKVLFPPWVVFQGEVVSKANNKKTGHTIGAVYSKVLINEFNPQSRDHIANRLKAKYGWQPTEFTDGGKPKIDEKVLGSLDYPEAKPLAELFLIEKRIGQIAEGTEAWLKHEKDGWIHHRLNPNGAVTGRATHSKINVTQVPKVGSRYGKECRALFGMIEKASASRVVGPVEGRCPIRVGRCWLRAALSRPLHGAYDKGEYGRAVIEGKEAGRH
jgi:DNA polymerase-1